MFQVDSPRIQAVPAGASEGCVFVVVHVQYVQVRKGGAVGRFAEQDGAVLVWLDESWRTQGVDRVFRVVVLPYFGLQVVSMCHVFVGVGR